MPLCNVIRRAKKMKQSDDEDVRGVDLNTTIEDDVFVPGPGPSGLDSPWLVHPKDYQTKGQRFRKMMKPGHKPNLVGTVYPDPLFGSKRVKRLDEFNIYDYIVRKNAVLILLYESVNEKLPANTEWSKNQLVQAAESTPPSGHGYATIDCTRDTVLCAEIRHFEKNRKVKEFPFFNFFSEGNLSHAITDYKTMDAKRMKQLVENKQPRDRKK